MNTNAISGFEGDPIQWNYGRFIGGLPQIKLRLGRIHPQS